MLLVQDSPESLCCVLEQDTLSAALNWFNRGNIPVMTEKLLIRVLSNSTKLISNYTTFLYSKTGLKQPLKNRQNKCLMENGSLMKVKVLQNAFCNTFDLH